MRSVYPLQTGSDRDARLIGRLGYYQENLEMTYKRRYVIYHPAVIHTNASGSPSFLLASHTHICNSIDGFPDLVPGRGSTTTITINDDYSP